MPKSPTTQVAQAPEPEILYEATTLFPFDFFTDNIKLTNESLVVTENYIIGSRTTTFLIKDILNVELNTSLLMSTLTIVRTMTPQPPYKIRNVPNAQAERLKNLIQGLLVLKNDQVELAGADGKTVKKKATEIGEITT